jgi:hypothetical protein
LMAMSRVGLAHHPSQASSVLHCLPFFNLFSLNSSKLGPVADEVLTFHRWSLVW